MKKTTFTLLFGWLLFLSTHLIAQNSEGRFALKVGDWFEMGLEQNNRDKGITNYLLRYELKKQLQNKNQVYQVSLEHFSKRAKYSSKSYGYDSYYPSFEENKTSPEKKNQYTLELTPLGKLVNYEPFKDNKSSKIELIAIGSSYGSASLYTYSDDTMDSLMVSVITNYLLLPDSSSNRIRKITDQNIPFLIELPDMKLILTDASFPLPNNTIIQGKMEDQINQEIRINMVGSYSESYFTSKQFQTNKDGSFNCPIFLKRPFHLRLTVGKKTLTTFLEPGDTLNLSPIKYLAHQLAPIDNHTKNQEEDISEMKEEHGSHLGRAQYNTMLSTKIDQYLIYSSFDQGHESIITISQKTDKIVNKLIDSYQGKASDACVEYFRRAWNYFLAAERLKIYEGSRRSMGNKLNTNVLTMKDFPVDFFLGVDTLPVLMNPFEWDTSYQIFISEAQRFKQKRIGWPIGELFFQSFNQNYFFSLASLRGYPLYKQIAGAIEMEYTHGAMDNQLIEPYYQDFINNCGDPVLVEPLKKIHEMAIQFGIGRTFPINSFVLQDSSIFDLNKFKGKPICLILLSIISSDMNDFQEIIDKFAPEEVNFIFAITTPFYDVKKILNPIHQKPNVTIIRLADKNIVSEFPIKQTKIFMLDKWFRIVENNAEDPSFHKYKGSISGFEKSLRKTIETKRYSKAEKTAMVKTAGWSFGSILFTVLIGLWIYKSRIRRIKKQEAAKRRIKELEIKAIRSQMNPHFIFNALNSIQSLINGNQFKEANIYLSKFAVLLRGVLNNSEKGKISLSDELQAVELYCQLEQLRFEFKFGISIDPDVNVDLIEIPGMIIQPLAENAVVHGLSGKGELGKLDIQVKRHNGNLCIDVSDNGLGLSPQTKDTLSQKGFGLKLVEERINILNLDGKVATLTVKNNQMAPGTLATLIIPID